MYLSRVQLNPRIKEVRRDISSPYDMHRTLHRFFSDASERFLWRLDTHKKYPVLLVQSMAVPNWGALSISDYFKHVDPSLELKYVEDMESGQLFRFCLRANTTVTREGKRLGVSDMTDQLQWLKTRSEKNGYELVGAMVSASQLLRFKRSPHSDSSSMTISLQATTFDGHLRVKDPELLKKAVLQGVGPAKSFGCGLLTLARG